MRELVIPGQCELDGDAESLDGHDTDGPDKGTNGNVHERRFLAIGRDETVYRKECPDEDEEDV